MADYVLAVTNGVVVVVFKPNKWLTIISTIFPNNLKIF